MAQVFRVAGRLALVVTLTAAALVGVTFTVTTTAGVAVAQASSNIVVQGNRRVDADTIRSYFAGPRLDAARIDEAVKALFATGLFEDVRVAQQGGRLVVTVVENAVINRVAFEGNRRINDETLASETQSKPRGSLNRALVQADAQRIVDLYRRAGRFDVQVNPVYIELPNGRVDLVFEINEGERTKVLSIEFTGNEAFSAMRLRDQIDTRESAWWRFLSSDDIYDPDRLEADKEKLRRFYLRNGYADFRVVGSTVDFDRARNGFVIRIALEEGPQYRFGNVDVVSNIRDVEPASLDRVNRARSGQVYNAEAVERSIEDMTIELARRGYAFASVRPRGNRDFEGRAINVAFIVEEGPRVYVERINIRGNTRTRDYVIRREFDIAEGDAYNRVLIDRAERRLRNLGYFKEVRITNEPGSAPDRVIVNVQVEDQPTGEFSISGGYSSVDGIIGEVAIGERNFLGRGQVLRASAAYGARRRGGEISFTEPYFMGYRLAAGGDLFYRQVLGSRFQSFDTTTAGGALRLGVPITENFALQFRYTLMNREVEVPGNLLPLVSPAIIESAGSTTTSMLGYSLVWNSLDNNQQPTRGILAEFRQDFAGVGGDVNFVRTTGDFRWYHDLGNDFIGMLRAQAGHIATLDGSPLRITDNFFLGPTLVRGFAPAGIGPRDVASPLVDALGGTTYWGASAEVQFPMPFTPREFGLRAALFADAGSVFGYEGCTRFGAPGAAGVPTKCQNPIFNTVAPRQFTVWDDSTIRSSVGVSVLWRSPIGPLRFDYGYALSEGAFDRKQAFRFSGGTRF